MEKSLQYLPVLIFVLLFGGNRRLVDANPFIGDKVSPAEENEFPFVVSLAKVPGNIPTQHFCTGTLISKNHVLTAAHCVENQTISGVVVSVGSNDVLQGVKHKIKKWKTFDEWATERARSLSDCFDFNNDIAIVTLEENVENIQPASVSNLNMKALYDKEVVALGWGITNFGIKPRFLQKVTLRVLKKKDCVDNLNVHGYGPSIVANHLCTYATPPIAFGCGDSGGPLLIGGDEIVGVNDSACGDHGESNQHMHHASVKIYREFIDYFIHPHPSDIDNDLDNNLDPFSRISII